MHIAKGQNYEESKNINGHQKLEGGMEGLIGRAQRIFSTVKLFYMILYWWTYVITSLSNYMKCET